MASCDLLGFIFGLLGLILGLPGLICGLLGLILGLLVIILASWGLLVLILVFVFSCALCSALRLLSASVFVPSARWPVLGRMPL